ncbi:MAG TPA: fructosamine kinase family protein [Phototrophicaceae bacterium]|nr:fructosamine kinase family protein [Phototrophicaceae bacterium]
MTEIAPIPAAVIEFCQRERFGPISAAEMLSGGVISQTRRLTTASGLTFILKQSTNPPPDLYACEAQSLRTLKSAGMHTPEILLIGADFLVVSDLGSAPKEQLDWEALGHALGQLHQHRNEKFGFEGDNYLGLLRQYNRWTDDGYVFFGQYRVLRFLEVPLTVQTLTSADRAALERLVSRLPELIPPQPPALLHGDLWAGNILLGADGRAALIDPAVYYGWPEAELAMAQQYPGIPRVFFDAYVEVNPLAPGWWERLKILYIREILSVIAHFGDRGDALAHLRTILAKFT